MKRRPYIKVSKKTPGKKRGGPWSKIIGINGEPIWPSETYSSMAKCLQTAMKYGALFGIEVRDEAGTVLQFENGSRLFSAKIARGVIRSVTIISPGSSQLI